MVGIVVVHRTLSNWKRFLFSGKFENHQKRSTVLSKVFKKAKSIKKNTNYVKVVVLKMKLSERPGVSTSGPSSGLHPGPSGWDEVSSSPRPSAELGTTAPTIFAMFVTLRMPMPKKWSIDLRLPHRYHESEKIKKITRNRFWGGRIYHFSAICFQKKINNKNMSR